MPENSQGRFVVITGASIGPGTATALPMIKEGAKVLLGAQRVDRLTALELGLGDDAVFKVDINKLLFRPTAQKL